MVVKVPPQGVIQIPPCNFEVWNLNRRNPDLPVVYLALYVANIGDQSGTFTVKVLVNGTEAYSESVTIDAGYVVGIYPYFDVNMLNLGNNIVKVQIYYNTDLHDEKEFSIYVHSIFR